MELKAFSLDGEWKLWEAPLAWDVAQYGRAVGRGCGAVVAHVPGDIHVDLVAAGRMPEPLLALNAPECTWVEDRSWWYDRTFTTQPEWLEADVVELELSGLDFMADVFLNESHIGRHPSAFRPFIRDIRELLRADGENRLVVRLTTGSERFSDADIASVKSQVSGAPGPDNRVQNSRVYMRKPQYVFGWDWNPRVPSCGITGGALIRPLKTVAIRDIHTVTSLDDDGARVAVTVSVESLDWIGTTETTVSATVTGPDGWSWTQARELFLRSGYNEVAFDVVVPDPKLWWPNGMGDQPLYEVTATAEAEGMRSAFPVVRFGLRTVEIDQSRIDERQRLFAIKVNGVRTYCKGADWIPADSIYARVSDEKYETLITEARAANFSMLRIWGGGLYEPDVFYEICDREGILLWHDFMFACAAYPDHEEWFVDEVRKEIEYQVVRLRNHPSIVVWCGNNENTWGFLDWWGKATKGGAFIYNNLIPRILADKAPDVPYWNSSPYGGKSPNCAEYGDRHHWMECMMNGIMEKRITPEEYDLVDPKFVSEYGYVGPCGIETTRQYLGNHPFDRAGKVWQHHNNTFEKDTVVAGVRKHYVDPERLAVDDYLLYAGLCQGMMLEYSLDAFRSRPNCSGGLFWMFNDCWGEVGWTIIDYYCRRKISFNFVRRANAHRRLIMRRRGEVVEVTLANDGPTELAGMLEYGYVSLDGCTQHLSRTPVAAAAFGRAVVAQFEVPEGWDLTQGLVVARMPEVPGLVPAQLRTNDFRNLNAGSPKLWTREVSPRTYEVGTDIYAHAVHLHLPDGAKPSDDYFDLLPGEVRLVEVSGAELAPEPLQVSSVVGANR